MMTGKANYKMGGLRRANACGARKTRYQTHPFPLVQSISPYPLPTPPPHPNSLHTKPSSLPPFPPLQPTVHPNKVHSFPLFPLSMAMATRASLFTPPTLPASKPAAPRSAAIPWTNSPFAATPRPLTLSASPRNATFKVSATEEKAEAAEAPVGFTPPQLDPNTPSPIFGGSTGGLLRKAQVEEFYVITWDSPKEQIFEMPTGGAAIMRQGPNLLKLARKEQCLALGTRLRSKYKINYQFYRVFPNGEVQYLHPKDGVYPEKVNPGRLGVGVNYRSIGKNVNPIEVKFTGKQVYDL